jgi:hypothetical protein
MGIRVDPVDQGNGAAGWARVHAAKAAEDAERSAYLNMRCGITPKDHSFTKPRKEPGLTVCRECGSSSRHSDGCQKRGGRVAMGETRLCLVCGKRPLRSDNRTGICRVCHAAPGSETGLNGVHVARLTTEQLRVLAEDARLELERRGSAA